MCLSIPGRVIQVEGSDDLSRMGKVDFGGVVKEICMAYVPEVKVGDYVIVHVGFAISIVDAEEAQKTFQYIAEMEGLEELKS